MSHHNQNSRAIQRPIIQKGMEWETPKVVDHEFPIGNRENYSEKNWIKEKIWESLSMNATFWRPTECFYFHITTFGDVNFQKTTEEFRKESLFCGTVRKCTALAGKWIRKLMMAVHSRNGNVSCIYPWSTSWSWRSSVQQCSIIWMLVRYQKLV